MSGFPLHFIMALTLLIWYVVLLLTCVYLSSESPSAGTGSALQSPGDC